MPVVKNRSAKSGDAGEEGRIPRSGRSPGEGNGNPLHYSCREGKIPWTEESGGVLCGSKDSNRTETTQSTNRSHSRTLRLQAFHASFRNQFYSELRITAEAKLAHQPELGS